jgi:hypothetical protein
LGARELRRGAIFGEKGPGVFADERILFQLLAILNCRLSSYLLRGLSPSLQFRIGYLLSLSLDPSSVGLGSVKLVRECICLKHRFAEFEGPASANCSAAGVNESLQASTFATSEREFSVASVLHSLEGAIERDVFAAHRVEGHDLQAVIVETGLPAG